MPYQRMRRSRSKAPAEQDPRQRVHADPLVPAQLAGCVVGDLAEVEAARRGDGGDEPGQPGRGLGDPSPPPAPLPARGGGAARSGPPRRRGRRGPASRRTPASTPEPSVLAHAGDSLVRKGVATWCAACREGRGTPYRSSAVAVRFPDSVAPRMDSGEHDEPAGPVEVVDDSTGLDALRAMRRTLRRHRLGELEWFYVPYRVYLAASLFGGAFFFVAGLVEDAPGQRRDRGRRLPPRSRLAGPRRRARRGHGFALGQPRRTAVGRGGRRAPRVVRPDRPPPRPCPPPAGQCLRSLAFAGAVMPLPGSSPAAA